MGNFYRPTIQQVIAHQLGVSYPSKEHLAQLLAKEANILKRLRIDLVKVLKDPDPKYIYVCGYCRKPVRLRGGFSYSKKQLHFTHAYPNPECKYHHGETPSVLELNRMVYAGLREGPVHQELKNRLAECLVLEGEHHKNISNVQVEKNIKIDNSNWKRPDINFEFEDKHIALELQLSSTYLDVIMERHRFYEENNIFMLWIFHDLTLDDAKRSFTLDDVIFRNNDNAYVFDDAQYKKSLDEQTLYLQCYYITYLFNKDTLKIDSSWNQVEVTLSDLTFDRDNNILYYFNSSESLLEARHAQTEYIEAKKERDERIAYLIQRKANLLADYNQYRAAQRTAEDSITYHRDWLKEIWKQYKTIRDQLDAFIQAVPSTEQPRKEDKPLTGQKSTIPLPSLASLSNKEQDPRSKYREQISKLNKNTDENIKRLEELKAYKFKYKTPDNIGLLDVSNRFDDFFYKSYRDVLYRRDRLSPVAIKYSQGEDTLLSSDLARMVKGDVLIYMPHDLYSSKIEARIKSDAAEIDRLLGELNYFEANFKNIKISQTKSRLDDIRTQFRQTKKQLHTEVRKKNQFAQSIENNAQAMNLIDQEISAIRKSPLI